MKFGIAVGVADVITSNKFFGDRSRGVDSVGVENCHLPLIKPVAVNTGLALPRRYRAARDREYLVSRYIVVSTVSPNPSIQADPLNIL